MLLCLRHILITTNSGLKINVLKHALLSSKKIQLMLEFYSGTLMHGQLYKNKVRYIGVGLHSFL